MREVEPEVYLVAQSITDWNQIARYLEDVDGREWLERRVRPEELGGDAEDVQEGELLIEFAGRLCYRSWKPGLNANVVKVRERAKDYLLNILKTGHGSVLEHSTLSFIFHNVSRVFTHELVRHRAGSAFSQESLRFVRLTDIPFWMPEWARADDELMARAQEELRRDEEFQVWMAEHFGLDHEVACPRCQGRGQITESIRDGADPRRTYMSCPDCRGKGTVAVPFSEKKAKTSFMRRFAPEGVATAIVWTANIRAIRHCIEMRTEVGAEEEIRLVFDRVAGLAQERLPLLFGDYRRDPFGAWLTDFRKV